MKFYCNNERGNIGRFNFEHRGYGLKFYQYDATTFKEERMHMNEYDIPTVEIVFNDVREIESLIIMLDRFRKECLKTDGTWLPKPPFHDEIFNNGMITNNQLKSIVERLSRNEEVK